MCNRKYSEIEEGICQGDLELNGRQSNSDSYNKEESNHLSINFGPGTIVSS